METKNFLGGAQGFDFLETFLVEWKQHLVRDAGRLVHP